jgi:antitoxin MazE
MTSTAKVQMWGNTRAVRIPKALAQQVGLETGTEVRLTAAKGGLLLQPVKKKKAYRLADLLAQCKGPNPHREMITGRMGREIF